MPTRRRALETSTGIWTVYQSLLFLQAASVARPFLPKLTQLYWLSGNGDDEESFGTADLRTSHRSLIDVPTSTQTFIALFNVKSVIEN